MEINFLRAKKGQASIEFIFLIIVVLVYMHAIILPTVNLATYAAKDAKAVSEAALSAQKLADSINYVASSSGDSSQVISLFIPSGAVLECTSNSVKVTVSLDPAAANPASTAASCLTGGGKTCVKNYSLLLTPGMCPQLIGPSMHRLKIYKVGASLYVSTA